MSSPHWNFRQILDVYPDSYSFTCVGTTKKGTRCGNKRPFLAAADLSKAAQILDHMDQLTKFKGSYQFLDELADSTLCKRWHRGTQTAQVSMRWQATIREYSREVKKEKERFAVAETRRQLAEMKEAALRLKLELEIDNKENIPPTSSVKNELPIPPKSPHRQTNRRPLQPKLNEPPKFPIRPTINIPVQGKLEDPPKASISPIISIPVQPKLEERPKTSHDRTTSAPMRSDIEEPRKISHRATTSVLAPPKLEDPFVDERVLKHARPNLFGSAVFGSAAFGNPAFGFQPFSSAPFSFGAPPFLSSKDVEEEPSEVSQSSARTPEKTEKVEDEDNLPALSTSLPSRPDTPLNSEYSSKRTTMTEFSPTSLIGKFPFPPGMAKPGFQFSRAPSIKVPPQTNFAYEFGAYSCKSMDKFRFELPQLDIISPIQPPPSLQECKDADTPVTIASMDTTFSSIHHPFEFDIPRKSSLRQRIPRLNTAVTAHNSGNKSGNVPVEITPSETPKCNASTATSTIKEEPDVGPATPPKELKPNNRQTFGLPVTPPYDPEIGFGYAVVTPVSTRYSTYLPARRQNGLLTPPETPEKLPPVPKVPRLSPRDADYFMTPTPRVPSLSIPRKPLPQRPSTSLKRRDEVRWRSSPRVCQICRAPYLEVGTCACADEKRKADVGVQVGCLEILHLNGLRSKIANRLEVAKVKVLRQHPAESAPPVAQEKVERIWYRYM